MPLVTVTGGLMQSYGVMLHAPCAPSLPETQLAPVVRATKSRLFLACAPACPWCPRCRRPRRPALPCPAPIMIICLPGADRAVFGPVTCRPSRGSRPCPQISVQYLPNRNNVTMWHCAPIRPLAPSMDVGEDVDVPNACLSWCTVCCHPPANQRAGILSICHSSPPAAH